MQRLIPGLVACLVALPLTVLAVVFVRSPASRDNNGVGLAPRDGLEQLELPSPRPD